MSFRELSMIDVREVLRRWQSGQSARAIARDGVADRKTAGRYIEAAESCELTPTDELTDDVVQRVAARVQARSEPERSEPRRLLDQHRPRIEAWLAQESPLKLVRVHELLGRDGIDVSYTTLRRYAHDELGWRERKPTVLIDDPPPGEEAQVDFGHVGYVRSADGHRRKLWVLIVTLSMSRYQFVWPTFRQTLEALCEGLDAAWAFFGGIVARVVIDNMTAAVVRASAQEPSINPSFLEYAQARGLFIDPARVRRPRDKARVENQVPYVRERWFAGETFTDDLVVLRESAAAWSRDVAGMRIHGTTRQVPRHVFENEERQHLAPPPDAPFDVPRWTDAKVHPDHHVQVARALYSAPTLYVGKVLRVRIDKVSVRLYFRNDLVKSHGRAAPGKRSTDTADYPVGKAPYARRGVEGLVVQARACGEHIGRYAEELLAGPLPWTKMRQAYALIRLCQRYGNTAVEALCARALAFEVVSVPRIERMLKQAQKAEDDAPKGRVIKLPASRFARVPASFATIPGAKKGAE
jgi:transposase